MEKQIYKLFTINHYLKHCMMKNSLESKIKAVVQKILFENFINETLEDVDAKTSNPKTKEEGEKIARRINGGAANYMLDTVPAPTAEYAAEILANAWKQGDGEYIMPSGNKFEINKPNIENGFLALFFPTDSSKYKSFLGANAWAIGDEETLDRLMGYFTGSMKHKNAIEKYQQISGNSDIPTRIKYLLTLYSNTPGTVKSFYEFMRNNLTNAARGYADDSQTVSLDRPMGGEKGGATFSSMVKSGDEEGGDEETGKKQDFEAPEEIKTSATEFGAKLKSFAKNFMAEMAQKRRPSPAILNFIALKTLVVADYPDKNTTNKRLSEIKNLYDSGRLNPKLMAYMDSRKAWVEKNPKANVYPFKEHSRGARDMAISMLDTAEEVARKEGYPPGFGEYLIENLLGMPLRANALLVKIALNGQKQTPLEVMKHLGVSRTRLIKMFQKIGMDESEISNIIKKVDLDVLEKIIYSDNPLSVMKEYRISEKILKEVLLNSGKTEDDANKIISAIKQKSQGKSIQTVDGGEDADLETVFANPEEFALNEEILYEEDMESLETTFPSVEDTMWVINNYR